LVFHDSVDLLETHLRSVFFTTSVHFQSSFLYSDLIDLHTIMTSVSTTNSKHVHHSVIARTTLLRCASKDTDVFNVLKHPVH